VHFPAYSGAEAARKRKLNEYLVYSYLIVIARKLLCCYITDPFLCGYLVVIFNIANILVLAYGFGRKRFLGLKP
jgi:hypothetical protein